MKKFHYRGFCCANKSDPEDAFGFVAVGMRAAHRHALDWIDATKDNVKIDPKLSDEENLEILNYEVTLEY